MRGTNDPFLKTILKENWMTDLLKLTGQTVAKLLKFKQPVLYTCIGNRLP